MSNKILKFLIVADLHGVKPKILVDLKNIDAIICPGDICSDDIRKYWIKLFKKKAETKNNDLTLDDVCPKWKQNIYDKISLRKGKRVLKYLNSFDKPVFVVPGNWDQTKFENGKNTGKDNWSKLKKGLINIHDIENKKINFRGITLIGHGST